MIITLGYSKEFVRYGMRREERTESLGEAVMGLSAVIISG